MFATDLKHLKYGETLYIAQTLPQGVSPWQDLRLYTTHLSHSLFKLV